VPSTRTAAFGELLRQHRLAAGLTQGALAEAAGLSERGLQDIERGARRAPRVDTVLRLIEALQLRESVRSAFVASARVHVQDSSTLPAPISSFVGRSHDVAEITRLLRSNRLLTLTGIGGIGKTRLGLRVAAEAASDYLDGVRLVELASLTDAGTVPQRIAAALGIRERVGRSPLDTLIEILDGRHMLLVIDNCEHVIEACAALVDVVLRACARVCVLATSREPLGIGGEQVWPVMPLAFAIDADGHDPEAVQLFVERALAASPRFALKPTTEARWLRSARGWTVFHWPSSWRRHVCAHLLRHRSTLASTIVSGFSSAGAGQHQPGNRRWKLP